jgi:hypothetical protein
MSSTPGPGWYGPHPDQEPQFQPSGPPPKPRRRKSGPRTGLALAALSAALVIAVGSCAARGGSTETTVPVPGPTVTATATETAPAPDPETVEVTPEVCSQALDEAEDLISLSQKGFEIASQMVQDAANQDAEALSDDTDKLSALTPKVRKQRDKYDAAATECNAS